MNGFDLSILAGRLINVVSATLHSHLWRFVRQPEVVRLPSLTDPNHVDPDLLR